MPMQGSILYTQVFPSPAGDLLLGECEGALCLCDWLINPSRREAMVRRMRKGVHAVFQPGETPLLQEACAQLHHYFEGERQTFTLPLRLVG
ncbi:MAG: cysteine methyltransferase, partial [bacterium]|nr:cysteine methyltransferase [bacterium]